MGSRPFSVIGRVWPWLVLAAIGGLGILVSVILTVVGGELADVSLALLIGWPLVGAVLVVHRPGNAVGKLMVGFAAVFGVSIFAELVVALGQQGAAVPALDLFTWLALVVITPLITLVVLLVAYFPSGAVESAWLRWPLRIAIGLTVLGGIGRAILPLTMVSGGTTITNPWAIESLAPLVPLDEISFSLVLAVLVAAAVDLIVRWRRSRGVVRLQMRALALAIGVFAFGVAVTFALALYGLDEAELVVVENLAWITGLASLPIAIGAGVSRYRLYDIDVVISKSLVYGALALLITGLYVGIVVGLGSVLGLYVAGDDPNTLLGLAALVVIPLVFQPARRWLERWANRVVYGRKSTPYEVLSTFSQGVAEVDPRVLVEVARSLAEGTTAEAAGIWSGESPGHRVIAVWPDDAVVPDESRLMSALIVHDGDVLGRVTLTVPTGQSLLPTDQKLLTQVASGLGIALRNQVLTADLESRVEQLRDSRRRIVAVQDRTRRQLERDLHDGAQQRLVALKIKLGLATAIAEKEGLSDVGSHLAELRDQADRVIETVREFARGIYPPLLEAEGLPAALSANFRKVSVPVSLQASGLVRYPREIEATVYFCLLDAVAGSVARGAGSVQVFLDQSDGSLLFQVRDDGRWPDPESMVNLVDRVDAAGGKLEVDSRPGDGTLVEARLPVLEVAAT